MSGQGEGSYSQALAPAYIGPEGKMIWKEKSSLDRLPCQLDLRKIRSTAITAFTVFT